MHENVDVYVKWALLRPEAQQRCLACSVCHRGADLTLYHWPSVIL